MHKIETNRAGGVGLPNGMLVAAAGLDIEKADWAAMVDHPVIAAMVADGTLVVDRKSAKSRDSERDENGDTGEMAELRRIFNRSFEQQGEDLKSAKAGIETLTGEVATLKGELTAKDADIADLKGQVADKDKEIASLKASATPAPLKAEHHGGGKFNITQGETVLSSGLTKADADAFNAMTDAEKAEYVTKSKAA